MVMLVVFLSAIVITSSNGELPGPPPLPEGAQGLKASTPDTRGASANGIRMRNGRHRLSAEEQGDKRTHSDDEILIHEIQEKVTALHDKNEARKNDPSLPPTSETLVLPKGIVEQAGEELSKGGYSKTKKFKHAHWKGRREDTPRKSKGKGKGKGKEKGKGKGKGKGKPAQAGKRSKRTILRNTRQRWDKGIMPYRFESECTNAQIYEYEMSMARLEFHTCMIFVRHTNTTQTDLGLVHNNFVNFLHDGGGCWSYVGNIYWWNGQSISCCGKWACIHELGHALGLAHEQKSYLRDDWIWTGESKVSSSGYYGERYDLASDMHYGWSSNIKPLDPHMGYLMHAAEEFFYMWKIISNEHNCQALACSDMANVTCENHGYISTYDGVCQCICPTGLDHGSNCVDVYQGDSNLTQLAWPGGSFALLKTGSSCPSGMQSGSITQGAEATIETSPNFNVAGTKSGENITLEFCTQSGAADNGVIWPRGVYCIHRMGGACPEGFDAGSLEFSDKYGATTVGPSPDATMDTNTTVLEYCCRQDGGDEDPLSFPTSSQFMMYQVWDNKCQNAKDMYVTKEYYKFNNVAADSFVKTGVAPQTSVSGSTVTINYCYYEPITYGCGGTFELSESNRIMTFSSPNYPSNYNGLQTCHWFIKAPVGATIRLAFGDFNVEPSSSGCYDTVEVRDTYIGQGGRKFCGDSFKDSIITKFETLMVTLKTDGTEHSTGFNATAEILLPEDFCYDATDKGETYRGDVDYTVDYETCVPWSEARNCRHNPFADGDWYDGLEGNACRRPGHGMRPWCYVSTETCDRNYCDVCSKDACYDLDETCDADVGADSNYCETTNGKRFCGQKCGGCTTQRANDIKVDTLSCPAPTIPADGTQTSGQAPYNVGDVVTFTCTNDTSMSTTSGCTTDGTWTVGGYACGACPSGWIIWNDACYNYFSGTANFAGAVQSCATYNAIISTGKDQEEINFLDSMRSGSGDIWLGITDKVTEGTWVWTDGTTANATFWDNNQPDNWGSGEDYATLRSNNKWNDISSGYTYAYVCKRDVITTRNVCADQITGCSEILTRTVDACSISQSWASIVCPESCGVCGTTQTCSTALSSGNVTQVTGTAVTTGEYVEYACYDGFVLTSGDLKRACLSTGSLSGIVPVCQNKSEIPWPNSDHAIVHRTGGSWDWWAVLVDSDQMRIKRAGKVIAWHFFSGDAGSITLQVYKVLSRNETLGTVDVELVGFTRFTDIREDREYYHVLPVNEQVDVEPGFMIGLDFDGYDSIKKSGCDKAENPGGANGKYGWFWNEGMNIGATTTFKPNTSCATYSVVAIVDPR